ncbi:Hypothetical predicted protein [Mytilus galloprovincialis]|uniref:CCHC-type domain-containing protein n=1 Tax=Mytilus galloprovincialis TaxID=29158 RepID=A0A8B6CRR9_MYTGA|nr:Hypothetical predicted protein [Mytilus galloprovincialis]
MDTDMLSSPLRNLISRKVSNAISTSQQDLLNSINGIMDSKLTNLQTTLQESQQEISQTQMAKMEETLTDNYTFQRKGNENQFKYGVKVLTKLKEAKSSLEVHDLTRATVQNAKSRISEGIDIVQERQKLIKLADSSQLGWKVVNEYVANPIAEDSEDERKMLRAQSRAERKSKAEKTKKSIKPRQVPYARNADKDDSFKPGKCFNCGKRGHWADNCPDRKQKISNSLYLSNLDSSSLFCSSDDNFYCNNSKIRNANEKVSITIDCLQKVDLVTYVEKPVSPVGRLKNAIDEWRLITDDGLGGGKDFESCQKSSQARNSKGVNISTVNFHDNFDVDLFCDASDVGFGGFCSTYDRTEVFGNWVGNEPFERVQLGVNLNASREFCILKIRCWRTN